MTNSRTPRNFFNLPNRNLAPLRLGCAVLSVLWMCACAAVGQDYIGVQPQVQGTAPELGDESGLPFSQVFRDTTPPYDRLFRSVRAGGRFYPKIGEGEAMLRSDLSAGTRMNIPLIERGGQPKNAELKIGNFYLDVVSASASALYSDNIRLSSEDRDDGVIAIARLNLAALYQLTDNLRLVLRGTLIYLPLQGEVGVVGFGVDDPMAGFEYGPLMHAQFTYDLRAGEWDIQVIDDFRVGHRRFGAAMNFELFDWEGFEFDEEDRAGRYVFRPRGPARRGGSNRDRYNLIGESFLQTRNLVGASASRILPTDTRAEVGAYHTDYWYHGRRNRNILPSSRDVAYAILASERESLRFKPYASYRISKYGRDRSWDQEARGGVYGPITENISILGEAGYYNSGNFDRETYVARAQVSHTISPIWYQRLSYQRGVTEIDRDLEQTWAYWMRRSLGPYVLGEFFAMHSEFEDWDNSNTGSNEDRLGLRFTTHLGQRSTLRLGGVYSDIDYNNPEFGHTETWTARGEFRYRYTDDLYWWIIYQFEARDSDRRQQSYHENLVIFTITKHF